ncbi:MAG: ISAs1 family transposase [Flavisolibacter sp.]|nr:ISAs1 family transposase [Flavisolibacter sp.]
MPSFFEHFGSLPDPRFDRTKLHKLSDILFITIAVVLSGCDDWNEIELYGETKEEWLRKYLELPNGIPSHDTFNRVFAALDPFALQACFLSWVEAVAELSKGTQVSIDDKRLCASGQDGKRSIIHVVSAWSEANHMVLAQVKVGDKSNVITAIPAPLDLLDLKGCIVTIDAMGCQREIASSIVDKEADHILAVKANQEFLLDDIKEAFTKNKMMESDTEMNMGHGRIERRICRVLQDTEWVCKAEEWKGLKTLIEISAERTGKSTGEWQKETRYYISSLAADAASFNQYIRGHWGIENHLHWTLDVVFSEDRSQKRAGNAAQNFALVNRIALNLLNNDKTTKASMKNKRHKAGWDNNYLLHLLTKTEIEMRLPCSYQFK